MVYLAGTPCMHACKRHLVNGLAHFLLGLQKKGWPIWFFWPLQVTDVLVSGPPSIQPSLHLYMCLGPVSYRCWPIKWPCPKLLPHRNLCLQDEIHIFKAWRDSRGLAGLQSWQQVQQLSAHVPLWRAAVPNMGIPNPIFLGSISWAPSSWDTCSWVPGLNRPLLLELPPQTPKIFEKRGGAALRPELPHFFGGSIFGIAKGFWNPPFRAALKGTNPRGQTPICGFLRVPRFPAKISGFLRKSALPKCFVF